MKRYWIKINTNSKQQQLQKKKKKKKKKKKTMLENLTKIRKKNEKWMKHILHGVDLWRGLNKPASNLMLVNVNIFS